jgi:hypothetical protein
LVGHGKACYVGGVPQVQAIHGILPVFFDCLSADLEDVGGLLVGMTFSDESKHFSFALGECFLDFGRGRRLADGLEQGRDAVAVGFFHKLFNH